jgi:hypothetical protein
MGGQAGRRLPLLTGRPSVPARPDGRELRGRRLARGRLLALLAAVGCIAAGCGSSSGAVSGSITIAGTTTISDATVGTVLKCKDGPSAKVPRWFGGSALRQPGVPGQIALVHKHDGSVTVSCKP